MKNPFKKHLIIVFILILTPVFIVQNTFAGETDFYFDKTEQRFVNEAIISLQLSGSNLTNCSDGSVGYSKVNFSYSYDKSKVELVSVEPLLGFKMEQSGSEITLEKDLCTHRDYPFIYFTFKNVDLKDGESTEFKIIKPSFGNSGGMRSIDNEHSIKLTYDESMDEDENRIYRDEYLHEDMEEKEKQDSLKTILLILFGIIAAAEAVFLLAKKSKKTKNKK